MRAASDAPQAPARLPRHHGRGCTPAHDECPVAERLRNALVAPTPDHPDAVDALRPLYDAAVVFRDPIQEVHGIEAFLALNRRLLKRMRRLKWNVVSERGDESEAFLERTMRGTPKLVRRSS